MTQAAPSFKKLARTRRTTLREDVAGEVEAFIEQRGFPTLVRADAVEASSPEQPPAERVVAAAAAAPSHVPQAAAVETRTPEIAPAPAVAAAPPPVRRHRPASEAVPAPVAQATGATLRPPKHEMTTISIELTKYAKRQLLDRAAHMECTVRFLIMDALKSAGYKLHEYDMQPDARRAPRLEGDV